MRHDRGVAMRRVAIIGSSGAGKSTLARRLGERTGLPVVHLDEHFWRPGWVETSRGEWRAVQTALCAQDAWIMDGNYSGTLDVRLARADTVVFLDLPRRVTIPGWCGGGSATAARPYRRRAAPSDRRASSSATCGTTPPGVGSGPSRRSTRTGAPTSTSSILRSRAEIRRWLDDLAPLADAKPTEPEAVGTALARMRRGFRIRNPLPRPPPDCLARPPRARAPTRGNGFRDPAGEAMGSVSGTVASSSCGWNPLPRRLSNGPHCLGPTRHHATPGRRRSPAAGGCAAPGGLARWTRVSDTDAIDAASADGGPPGDPPAPGHGVGGRRHVPHGLRRPLPRGGPGPPGDRRRVLDRPLAR